MQILTCEKLDGKNTANFQYIFYIYIRPLRLAQIQVNRKLGKKGQKLKILTKKKKRMAISNYRKSTSQTQSYIAYMVTFDVLHGGKGQRWLERNSLFNISQF